MHKILGFAEFDMFVCGKLDMCFALDIFIFDKFDMLHQGATRTRIFLILIKKILSFCGLRFFRTFLVGIEKKDAEWTN